MSGEILWNCEPRTRAKLTVISAYFGAWFGILASKGFKHVVYVDGFCGPGQYKTGEDGSPVIAARLASQTAAKFPGFRATLILIDNDQKALAHLQSLQPIRHHHPNVEIRILQGEFASQVEEIVSYLRRHPGSPTFSFVDPFGFGQSPLEKLKLLMPNEHSELFVNFWCGYMNRFKEHGNEEIVTKIKAMIGATELTEIINSPDPIEAFCAAFEARLKLIGKYTLKFMMRDEGNIRDNALFFCGRNSKGFEKIKEANWKIDPQGGNSFSAHREVREASQTNLFGNEPQTARLASMLSQKFSKRSKVPVTEIFAWVIDQTDVFLAPHARKELENLLNQGKIEYADPTASTRKRRMGEWPPRLLVTFKT